MLLLIPEDMLMNVVEYLDTVDRQKLRQTCTYVSEETKKKVGYLRLNENYSRAYMIDVIFREEVTACIADSKKQVALSIRGLNMICSYAEQMERVNAIQSVHSLILRHCLRSREQYVCHHDVFLRVNGLKEKGVGSTTFYISSSSNISVDLWTWFMIAKDKEDRLFIKFYNPY
jgi:hypothetical protein